MSYEGDLVPCKNKDCEEMVDLDEGEMIEINWFHYTCGECGHSWQGSPYFSEYWDDTEGVML